MPRCSWYYCSAEVIDGVTRYSEPERYCEERAVNRVISDQNGSLLDYVCEGHRAAYENCRRARLIPLTGRRVR